MLFNRLRGLPFFESGKSIHHVQEQRLAGLLELAYAPDTGSFCFDPRTQLVESGDFAKLRK